MTGVADGVACCGGWSGPGLRGGPGPRQQCAPSGHRCGDQEEVVDRCDEHLQLSLLLDSVEAHPVQASRRAEVWGGGARWQQYFFDATLWRTANRSLRRC